MSQWRIQGRGPGTPLFLVETEARGADKQFFWDPPPPPISGSGWPCPTLLSEGLDLPLIIVVCGAQALYICVLLWTGIFFSIRHFYIDHNSPCLPPKILHNLCLRFLLGRCNTQEKYNWKQWLCKNEKSEDYSKADLKQRVLFFITIFRLPIPAFFRFTDVTSVTSVNLKKAENMCLKPGVVLNSLPSSKDGRMSCFGGFLLQYV